MSYRVVAKIGVPDINTKDPINNGVPKDRIVLDLKILKDGKELNSEQVIAEGFAYRARFGFRRVGDLTEAILFEGHGASDERFPAEGGPEGGRFAGKAIPLPGYIEEGSGISAIFDSNGLTMKPNFKHQEDGCYQGFAEVEGIGRAEFPHGDTICVGKAAARKHGG